jgi:peptidoglycan L-alanyl-D-glutamate endopeptidase CwlK
MTFQLGRRSLERLHRVHPDLVRVVLRAIEYTTVDFRVEEGARDEARQLDLVEQGFSKTMASKHLIQPDDFAHAVDLVAVGDLNGDGKVDHQDKALTWDKSKYSLIADAMTRAAEELGVRIRWGGDFKSFFDGPHFELVA